MPMTFDQATVDGTGAFLVHELERLDQTLNLPLVNFTGRAISSCVKTCLLLMRSARSLTPLLLLPVRRMLTVKTGLAKPRPRWLDLTSTSQNWLPAHTVGYGAWLDRS